MLALIKVLQEHLDVYHRYRTKRVDCADKQAINFTLNKECIETLQNFVSDSSDKYDFPYLYQAGEVDNYYYLIFKRERKLSEEEYCEYQSWMDDGFNWNPPDANEYLSIKIRNDQQLISEFVQLWKELTIK